MSCEPKTLCVEKADMTTNLNKKQAFYWAEIKGQKESINRNTGINKIKMINPNKQEELQQLS